jgi:hypothetical protein
MNFLDVGKTVLSKDKTVNLLEGVSAVISKRKPRVPSNLLRAQALSFGLTDRYTTDPASSSMAFRIANLMRTFTFNVKELGVNWEAFVTALELIYGRPRENFFAPSNRATINKWSYWIIQACCVGVRPTCKLLSALARDRAIRDKDDSRFFNPQMVTRGKERKALFIASTLSRAIRVARPSKAEVDQEVLEAKERLTKVRQLPPQDVLDELRTFIHDTFKRKQTPAKYRCLPLPNGKSCLEAPSSKGGSRIAYTLFGEEPVEDALDLQPIKDEMKEIEDFIKEQEGRFDYYTVSNSEDDDVIMAYFRWQELDAELNAKVTHKIDDEKNTYDKFYCRSLTETFNRCTFDSSPLSKTAKVFALVTPEGKIRVPTMHSASVVWQARAMTAFLLSYLGKIYQTRTALKNRPLVLHNDGDDDTFIFSADLSKSTDPIGIELSKFVLNELIACCGVTPEWWDRALANVVQAFSIADDADNRSITCGALMGLGPSWTVLSVLNAFAAHRAGARKGDHEICGDDLIADWTRSVRCRYQENITILGMENNLIKSFESRDHGVFCERFVRRCERKGEIQCRGPQLIRIGEAVGMRALDGKKGRLVVDDLFVASKDSKQHRVIRSLALRTATRLAPNRKTPGLLRQGGGGSARPLDLKAVIAYILKGPIQLTHMESDSRVSDLRNHLRDVPDVPNGISPEDVLSQLKSVLEIAEPNLNGKDGRLKQRTAGEIFKSVREHRRAAASHIKACKGRRCYSIQQALLNEKAYVRNSPKLMKNVLILARKGKFTSIMKLLTKSWRKGIDPRLALGLYDLYAQEKQYQPDIMLAPTRGVWDSFLPP